MDELRIASSWASVTPLATVVPTVTTSATVSDISSSGGTLGGSVSSDGNGSITERGIYYSTSSGFANGAGTKVSATGSSLDTGAFTQIVTGLNPNTTYYFKAFAANSAGAGYGTEQSFTTANVSQTPPTISAAPAATVDGNIELTFTDNAAYRAAITEIKVGGTTLPVEAYSTLTEGKIILNPAASTLLQSAGSKIITITASNYELVNINQSISHGVATKLGILTAPVAPAANGGAFATQPVVAVQDQYGNTVLTSTDTVTAAVGSGGWILGGTAGVAAVNGVANFSGLTAGKVGTLTGGTISFTSGSLTVVASGGFNLPLPVLTITTIASYNEGVTGQTGSVTIPFAAPTDISVTLASSSAVDLKVDGDGNGYVASTTVLIASGSSSASFFLETPADNTIDANASVTLTASATDFTSGTRTITVANVDYVAPTIVINKVLNDSPVDTVELLVVGNGTPGSTVNLQGMILKDYSSSGASDGGGSYTFVTSTTWASVKAGTLIVLSNQAVGTEDLDGSDFLIRANLQNTALFNSLGTFNVGGTEMVQIKASGSAVAGSAGAIHSFAFGSTSAAQIAAAPLPKLVNQVSGNLQVASNTNSTLADFSGSGITLLTVAPTTGIPHNSQNTAYIDSLRGVQSVAVGIAAESAILNENAAEQVNAITVSLSSPAASNLTVNLSASPSDAVTLPASVEILSGNSSATVSFTPVNDTVVAGNRTVTITASATGFDPGSNQFTLVDVQFNNPSIVINELVNGGTGGTDSAELLVIQDKLNAVGMIFKDFSGNMGGDGGRQFTFNNVALWQSLPAGTLIVLSTDATMVEDFDPSDFLIKVQVTNTTYLAGSGGSSLDISNIDMVMIKAAGSGTSGISGAIHTFGSGAPGNNFKLANGAKLLLAAGGAGGGADNATSAIGDYNGTGVTAGTATLGTANNANNQTYISALQASVNRVPTDIGLTATSIAENNAVDANVGTLSTTDADTSDTHTYSLVAGTGSTDNGSFNISGTSLRASTAFDFETKSSYSIRVRTTDSANNTFEKAFTITVTDMNETPADTTAPVITLTGSATVTVAWGGTYSDAGATATDNVDSSVTVNSSGSVNTAVPGTYTITYTASDAAGNAATPVSRAVTVSAPSSTPGADGLSGLFRYAFGANGPNDTVTKPTTTVSGGNLVLTAIVRTNDSKLAVVGEAVTNLASYTNAPSITTVNGSASGIDQTGVPAGCEKQAFTVPQASDARKFLRLKATLAP